MHRCRIARSQDIFYAVIEELLTKSLWTQYSSVFYFLWLPRPDPVPGKGNGKIPTVFSIFQWLLIFCLACNPSFREYKSDSNQTGST